MKVLSRYPLRAPIPKGRLQLHLPWLWNEATNVIVNGVSEQTIYTYMSPSASFQETLFAFQFPPNKIGFAALFRTTAYGYK